MDIGAVRNLLVDTKGVVDFGHTDPCYEEVTVRVTPAYAAWLVAKEGKDISVMQSAGVGAFSSHGPGKFAVQTLLHISLAVVDNLIQAGVPKEVAFGLLPHELYEHISKP